jgi:flavin-dependent thymidylate synthase
MKLVKPSYEIWDSKARTLEQQIEKAGRCCYKSESKIAADGSTATPFCKMLIADNHESVLEHANVVLSVDNETYDLLHEWDWAISWTYVSEGLYAGWYPVSNPHLRYSYSVLAGGQGPVVSGNVRAWRDVLRIRDDLPAISELLAATWPTLFGEEAGIPVHLESENGFAQSATRVELSALNMSERVEHQCMTVKFVIDRGVSHELVRHRVASYSQESTRYCDYAKTGEEEHVTFVIPPWVDINPGLHAEVPHVSEGNAKRWFESMLHAEADYKALRLGGWRPEQARDVLPVSLKTEIVMTANVRSWCHVFRMRCAEQVHPQMREVMAPLKAEMQAREGAIMW